MSDKNFLSFLNHNKSLAVEALRIYLGLGFLFKGYFFLNYKDEALRLFSMVPFENFVLSHLVVFIHLVGGFFLVIGFLTRVFAFLQIPLLLGAIVFVHWPEGFWSINNNLEFVMLLLFLMVFFTIYGGGAFSVDRVLESRLNKKNQ